MRFSTFAKGARDGDVRDGGRVGGAATVARASRAPSAFPSSTYNSARYCSEPRICRCFKGLYLKCLRDPQSTVCTVSTAVSGPLGSYKAN